MLAGDLQGFPNGRRLTDDVVDIALQAVEGAAQTGKLVDALAAGDTVDAQRPRVRRPRSRTSPCPTSARSTVAEHAAADPNAAPIVPPGDDDSPAPSLSPAAARGVLRLGTGSVLTVAVLGRSCWP